MLEKVRLMFGNQLLRPTNGNLNCSKLFGNFFSDVHSFSIVLAITRKTGRCCKYHRNVKQNYSNIQILDNIFLKSCAIAFSLSGGLIPLLTNIIN